MMSSNRSLRFALVLAGIAISSQLCPGEEKPTVYCVAGAHWDTQWNWDMQRSINEFLPNTLKQNFSLFEQYPDYIFNLEGAVKYDMAKEYMPELYEQLRSYVKSGRWHVSGAGWDANDPNIPSVESNIRNYLYGQHFFKTEFGVKSTDVMLPDCFGFNCLIPTVASHCGLIGFGTQKLKWRKRPFYEDGRKVPFNFGIWEGLDGSRIMATMDGGSYSWTPKKDIRDEKDLKIRIQEASIPAVYKYFGTRSSRGHGDQGGSPLPISVEMVDQAARNPLGYNVRFATSDQMYRDYYMDPRLKVYKGELLMDVHATGCYTSHSEIKRLNRRIELLLSASEALGVLAEQLGVMEYPSWTLDQIWKRTLVHQFHDDLTGTSIPDAYKNTYNDHYLSVNQLENLLDAQMQAVGRVMNTRVKGIPVAVFNPVSSDRKDCVTAEVTLPSDCRSVAVYDQNGRRVRSQLLSRDGDKAVVAFSAQLPSLSFSVFEVRPVSGKDAGSSIKVGADYIENSVYRVRLDGNGDICSIVDKRCGQELVKSGEAFALNVFENNASTKWPAWEILKNVMDREPVKVDGDVKVSCEYRGPVKAALRVERRYGESVFVQRIVLSEGAADDRIDIETEVDWQSRECLLKAAFPVAFPCAEASYGLGLGHVRRGNNTDIKYEVYAQQWADMTADDGSYGVTVMNSAKYGWDKPDDNTLRLTLLHTPAVVEKRYDYQGTMDIGKHCFSYSIVGHKGKLDPVAADIAADFVNQPVMASIVEKGFSGQRQLVLARSTNPAIRIKAVKKAVDGEGYVIRTYEQSGSDSKSTISLMKDIVSARNANGIEEPRSEASFSGKSLFAESHGFGLGTYRVQTACDKPSMPVYTTLELPYNVVGISTDAFSAFGHLDSGWHSFAAELIPENFSFRGVPYRFGRPDFNNVLCCKGQRIELPEGTKTVHLLLASVTSDKTAVFNAGKDVEVFAGWFSGYFGFNAWVGQYEGVSREGNVAYVGTHRHDAYKRNEAYMHTYMFYADIPVGDGASSLVLPDDREIAVFAVTAER